MQQSGEREQSSAALGGSDDELDDIPEEMLAGMVRALIKHRM